MPSASATVVLLGAQRFQPTLGDTVAALGIEGRVALITAGWQEREGEDEELSEHLGGRTVNLALHARGDDLFREDPDLHAAHRERQDLLRHLQDFYRIRLDHSIEAERAVRTHNAPPAIRDEVEEEAINAIRGLDAWHMDQCARIHAEFDAEWDLASRPSVARHRAEIAELLSGCEAVAIAGGHVAILVNRLLIFGLDNLIENRTVFAWSGGAMAVSERVFLFHDDPPQGKAAGEVLDVGLGLVPDVIVLPEPERRLLLDERDRVQLLARRFAPARCLALPARTHLTWRHRQFSRVEGVIELCADGQHHIFNPSELSTAAE